MCAAGAGRIILMKTSKPMRFALAVALALMSGAGSTSRAVQRGASPCSFRGPEVEQAKCLLRRVGKYGEVEREPTTLPPTLERLIGRDTAPTVTTESLGRYLAAKGVREDEI